ncbi:MAG: carbamoyl-phosphate synthase small subunit [Gammaproteobacteria bacterium]
MGAAAILSLEDGSQFVGAMAGAAGETVGEVVFNTAMTGYQEILTDPSYARQLVTLTYPHIGNTGVTEEDEEAADIFASGLIVRDLPMRRSNWRAGEDLTTYLVRRGIVALAGIDTRRLTRLLRTHGAQRGAITAGPLAEQPDAHERGVERARAFPGLAGMDLAKEVSSTVRYPWTQGVWDLGEGHRTSSEPGRWRVVAYDFGVKRNILRLLVEHGCDVTVVPAKTTADEVMALRPDGVFLSNGPGDPEPCTYAIEAIRALLEQSVPIFGICLGHQLLALASGARTVKMKFGHHGANHPVKDVSSGRVIITSQNHGFAVDEATLPEHLVATHRSLFDGSLQGVRRTDKPAFSFQGHPEASPGPQDAGELFQHFIALMESAAGTTVR